MRDAGRWAAKLSPTVYESSDETRNCQQRFTHLKFSASLPDFRSPPVRHFRLSPA